MKYHIEIETKSSQSEVIGILADLHPTSLKIEQVGSQPKTPTRRRKLTRGSKSPGKLVKLGNGNIDIDATLYNIGRTKKEVLSNKWKKGTIESRIKMAINVPKGRWAAQS